MTEETDVQPRREAYVLVEYTAYPLAPNTGYACERAVSVYYEPGYHVDLVCTVHNDPSTHDAIAAALTMAAALSGRDRQDVRVQTRYYRREHRNAVVEARVDERSSYTRQSPRQAIDRAEFDALLQGAR
jgi:hypothetical protein